MCVCVCMCDGAWVWVWVWVWVCICVLVCVCLKWQKLLATSGCHSGDGGSAKISHDEDHLLGNRGGATAHPLVLADADAAAVFAPAPLPLVLADAAAAAVFAPAPPSLVLAEAAVTAVFTPASPADRRKKGLRQVFLGYRVDTGAIFILFFSKYRRMTNFKNCGFVIF